MDGIAIYGELARLRGKRSLSRAVRRQAEKLFKVRVKTFTATPRVAVVTANGATTASRRVDARARTNGTIMESLFKQGQSVKEGDVLCRLDMADRESNLGKRKRHWPAPSATLRQPSGW